MILHLKLSWRKFKDFAMPLEAENYTGFGGLRKLFFGKSQDEFCNELQKPASGCLQTSTMFKALDSTAIGFSLT